MTASFKPSPQHHTSISPVVAAIFLIMITIAAAFLLYNYVQTTLPAPEEAGSPSDLQHARLAIDTGFATVLRSVAVTISNPHAQNLSDYQVKVTLGPGFPGWGVASADRLFFTTMEGRALYYWVESFDAVTQTATLWVRVPHLPPGSSNILLWYGSVNPNSDYNDPWNVFYFYEDAETGAPGAEWGITNGAGRVLYNNTLSYEGSQSLLKTDNNDPNGAYKPLRIPLNRLEVNITAEFKVYRPSPYAGGPVDRIGLIDPSGNGYGWASQHGVTQRLYIDRRDGFTPTVLAPVSISNVENQWYNGSLFILSNGTVSALWDNGTHTYFTSTTETTYSLFTHLYIFGGWPYHVDRIIVRQYVEPEPSATVGTSEVNRTLVSLYLRNTGGVGLKLSKLYIYDKGAGNTLLDTVDLGGVLIEPGETRVISHVLPAGHLGYLEAVVVTEEGVKAKLFLSVGEG